MHLLRSNNQLKDEWHYAFDETFVLIHHQLGGTAHLIFIGNGCINQLKDKLKSQVFVKYQLTVASPLGFSMLTLLN
jgi:hypothetical protein